jgi:hypothetical protein
MVMHAVDAVIVALSGTDACKDMHLVAAALQRCSQFRHVGPDAANGYGVK